MSVALPTGQQHEASSATARWKRRWDRCENWLAQVVDRCNPILVKETRQALKSRQFVITFLIVLVACWIVSFGGVAIIGPQIKYAAAGGVMLIAYFVVLAFPLCVIVPFSAFRSLASEQEDNTYDLLSITTLSSRQIIAGKLCSAIVQMLVYFCAVSPCVAFTFLLRGVEATSVGLLLLLTLLESTGLSLLALLVGTLSRVRYTQVIVSVGLVIALCIAFIGSIATAVLFHEESHQFIRERDFWIGLAAGLTLYATALGLVFRAAAAQIAFPSENRSSAVRRWMLIQQSCFVGWLSVPVVLYPESSDSLAVSCALGGIAAVAYWYIMGTLMTGEWPHLSRRVQRSLPQSTLGRTLFTWFNPGPGTGYMFAVANLGMLALLGLTAVAFWSPQSARRINELAVFVLIFGWCYVTIFLGIGRLIINAVRRFTYVPMSGGILLQLILVLVGVGIPLALQMASRSFGRGYSLIHMVDPLRTMSELVTRGPRAIETGVLVIVLPAAAIVVLLLNLRSVMSELHRQRTAAPTRVLEEDASLETPLPPKPTNPWETDAD